MNSGVLDARLFKKIGDQFSSETDKEVLTRRKNNELLMLENDKTIIDNVTLTPEHNFNINFIGEFGSVYERCIYFFFKLILDTFSILVLIPDDYPFKNPTIRWMDINVTVSNISILVDKSLEDFSVQTSILQVLYF